jgi:uncharacterized protein (DUF433 family)
LTVTALQLWTLDWHTHITVDPAVMVGKPVIKGTRLIVDFLLGLLADGWPDTEIIANYPGVTTDDIRACIQYAREALQYEHV